MVICSIQFKEIVIIFSRSRRILKYVKTNIGNVFHSNYESSFAFPDVLYVNDYNTDYLLNLC